MIRINRQLLRKHQNSRKRKNKQTFVVSTQMQKFYIAKQIQRTKYAAVHLYILFQRKALNPRPYTVHRLLVNLGFCDGDVLFLPTFIQSASRLFLRGRIKECHCCPIDASWRQIENILVSWTGHIVHCVRLHWWSRQSIGVLDQQTWPSTYLYIFLFLILRARWNSMHT